MSGRNSTDIMAWMQKAYIAARPDPWYRKLVLRVKLFIDRHFNRVKGTPGAKMLDNLDAIDKARREARIKNVIGY